MTTKLPSGLAASGPADETDSEQITKEHSDEVEDIDVDPSDDVTVEASEDVTSEAVAGTPLPSLSHTPAPIVGEGGTPAPRLSSQTLLGVPIQSLPLPGVTAASTRSDFLDEHEEVTAMAPSIVDDLLARGPSITDDDEEETKVEPAETAIKAAASIEDVSTALSAQASVEREKALRRSSPPMMAAPSSADLEFEDPAGDDDDEGEVLSASAADEIEDDEDADASADDDADETGGEDVATGTFAKPVDSTGFSGLLNARRSPPMGSPFGRDGFGSARLPTPSPGYAAAAATAPAPSTSPFSARLSPVPAGSPYGARATTSSMPAIQIPAPSAAPATTEGTGLFSRVQVPMGLLGAAAISFFFLGFGVRAGFWPSRPVQTVVVTKTVPAPATPTPPSVEPVQPAVGGTITTQVGGSVPTPPKAAVVEPMTPPPGIEPDGMPRPIKKVVAAKPRKPVDDTLAEEAVLKPAKLTASVSKPAPAPAPVAKPAAVAGAKPAKKPSKVWVDPFAQ